MMNAIDNCYLTTDASPSAPRDEKELNNEKPTDEAVGQDQQHNKEPAARCDIKECVDTKKKTKCKTKKISNQGKYSFRICKLCANPFISAYANVINISNSNGIHIGSNYTVNQTTPKTQKKKPDIVKTDAINLLLNSTTLVTTKDIVFISNNIGEGWRDLFRLMDYIEAQIDQFYETHIYKGVKEVCNNIVIYCF